MTKLDDREWKPIPIISVFDRFEPGKGKGLNHLEQAAHGISYIGATNRNNGVLCFVKDTDDSRKMMQEGNCIGFIKNGDGSAGYAIYKQEPFVSTSDVIYGYASWLNPYTGLFFVTAQDMIEHKYSHGYKRNAQHLKGDRVMLPVSDAGEPDYQFMEDYIRELMIKKRNQYLSILEQRIKGLGVTSFEQADVWEAHLNFREWKPFYMSQIFNKPLRGKRIVSENHIAGNIPLVSSMGSDNGVTNFVGNTECVRRFHDCLTIANGGSYAGKCYYQPFEFIGSDHVTQCNRLHTNIYQYLFLSQIVSQSLIGKYGFSHEIKDAALPRERIMLPVTRNGDPDFNLMETLGKAMIAKKYMQYMAYLKKV